MKFTHKNKPYEYIDGQLYKEAFYCERSKRHYVRLECAKWIVNSKHVGFTLGSDRLSFGQIEMKCKQTPSKGE